MKANTGSPFLALLALLFIGLKLADYIDWSWWWVLSPLWFPAAIVFLIMVGDVAVWCARRARRR